MLEAKAYRLSLDNHYPLHGQILALLISTLVLPKSKAEQATNADILNEYTDTFDLLAHLPPEQLHAVAGLLDGAAEIYLSPSALHKAVHEVVGSRKRHQYYMQRCEWLIRHGGSNRMILLLCRCSVLMTFGRCASGCAFQSTRADYRHCRWKHSYRWPPTGRQWLMSLIPSYVISAYPNSIQTIRLVSCTAQLPLLKEAARETRNQRTSRHSAA